jgi:glutamate synthase (ferredoxin)
MAAILGADEYSFDAVALAASGRQPIHASANNTYLASIPAQQSHLRAKFAGMPEGVTVYLRFLAEEVRQILAQLGFRCLEDIIGQTELLRQIATGDSAIDRLDLSLLLAKPASPYSSLRPASGSTLQHSNLLTRPEVDDLNKLLLEQASPALITGEPVQLTLPISHTDRTIGASLAGEIAKRYGDRGLPDNTLNFTFLGSAGHSFGAFLVPGLNLTLIGEANGYVGQGMAGGQIVVRPSLKLHLTAGDPIIMGNTALYGATGGSLFVAGQAGERFAGRNNGAIAVIEGLGDHGCEYMNDGVVVVLGRTGYNFGAAMSGGLAFVLDEGHHLTHRLNPDRVQLVRITKEHDAALLKHLIIRHVRLTGSPRGQAILDNWLERLGLFWKVAPKGTVGSSAIQTAERLPDLSGLVA